MRIKTLLAMAMAASLIASVSYADDTSASGSGDSTMSSTQPPADATSNGNQQNSAGTMDENMGGMGDMNSSTGTGTDQPASPDTATGDDDY